MPSIIDEEAMQQKGKGNLPFDMNKPPLKAIPHQDYPKMLYRWPKDKTLHPTSKTAIAKDAEEEKALKVKGWRDQPHVQEHPEEAPDGFEADDAVDVAGGEQSKPVEAMTKAELLAHAKDVHGLELDPGLKKEQIVLAITEAAGKKAN